MAEFQEQSQLPADYSGLLTEPTAPIVERAQRHALEIQPWYWKFGHTIRRFYRDIVSELTEKDSYFCLASGDVRSGKTVAAAMWAAEEPERVAYWNLQGLGSQDVESVITTIKQQITVSPQPEVLILDEISESKDIPLLIGQLHDLFSNTRIIGLYPLRWDEGIEKVNELGRHVLQKNGLLKEIPGIWDEAEIHRYLRERLSEVGLSVDEQAVDVAATAIHYLSLGVPKCIQVSSETLISLLKEQPAQTDLNSLTRRGIVCYIKPDAPIEYREEERLIGYQFSLISEYLYQYVLRAMPPERFRHRLEQQARIGLAGRVKHLLNPEERITMRSSEYSSVPIFRPEQTYGVEPATVLTEEELTRVLRQVLNYIDHGQSVALADFTTGEEAQLLKHMRQQPGYAATTFVTIDLYALNEQVTSATAPKDATVALYEQVNPQLGVAIGDPMELDRFLKQIRPLIILEGVRDCIELAATLDNIVNNKLRSLGSHVSSMIARGNISKVENRDDLVSSPLFNIFTMVKRPVKVRT